MSFLIKRKAKIIPMPEPVVEPLNELEKARLDVMESDAEVARIAKQLGQLQREHNLVVNGFGVIQHLELPDATGRSGMEQRVRELINDYGKALAEFSRCLNIWAGLKGQSNVATSSSAANFGNQSRFKSADSIG